MKAYFENLSAMVFMDMVFRFIIYFTYKLNIEIIYMNQLQNLPGFYSRPLAKTTAYISTILSDFRICLIGGSRYYGGFQKALRIRVRA